MKERFKGRLRAKRPKNLISNQGKNELDDFFLALALVYNDLKGIILFQDLLNANYEKAGPDISPHDGEFGGLNMQIVRIISSMINEFLELVRDSAVTKSKEFLDMLENHKPEVKKLWEDLIAISRKERVQKNVTNYALMRIRANITSHYKDAGKNLRKGFVTRFYDRKKDKAMKNTAAFYSLEDTLEKTRFYYADAAAEEFMWSISKDWQNYIADINSLVRAINNAIFFLMKDYLKNKANDIPLNAH